MTWQLSKCGEAEENCEISNGEEENGRGVMVAK